MYSAVYMTLLYTIIANFCMAYRLFYASVVSPPSPPVLHESLDTAWTHPMHKLLPTRRSKWNTTGVDHRYTEQHNQTEITQKIRGFHLIADQMKQMVAAKTALGNINHPQVVPDNIMKVINDRSDDGAIRPARIHAEDLMRDFLSAGPF
jgi:hypothetical protein